MLGTLDGFTAEGKNGLAFLQRHVSGDYGDLCNADRCENGPTSPWLVRPGRG